MEGKELDREGIELDRGVKYKRIAALPISVQRNHALALTRLSVFFPVLTQ